MPSCKNSKVNCVEFFPRASVVVWEGGWTSSCVSLFVSDAMQERDFGECVLLHFFSSSALACLLFHHSRSQQPRRMDHNLSAHRKVLSAHGVFVSSPGDRKMSHTVHGMTSQQLTAARFSEKKRPRVKLTMLISFLLESAWCNAGMQNK